VVFKEVLSFSLMVLLILAIRIPLWQIHLDNDSGGFAYHARLMLQGEELYGSHHPSHYLPGIYYTYAGLLRVFGDRENSIKVGIVLVTAATAFFVYKILEELRGRKAAWLAVILYALLSQHDWLKGATGETEVFANLPITFALYLLLRRLSHAQPKSWWFVIGLLAGVAVLYKPQFISPLVAGFITVLYLSFGHSQEGNPWRKLVKPLFGLGLGFFVPLAGIYLFYQPRGLGDELLKVFTYGQNYLGSYSEQPLSLWSIFIPLAMLSVINFPLTILGLVTVIRVLRGFKADWKSQRTRAAKHGVLLAWFVVSLLQAGITQFGYPHYTLIVSPGLAVLSALELASVSEALKRTLQNRLLQAFAAAVLALIVIAGSIPTSGRLYYHYLRLMLGSASEENFLRKGLINGEELITIDELTEFLLINSSKDDQVYYWSDNVQLYYLAERRNPLPNEWPIYAGVIGAREDLFGVQTRYIILGHSDQAEIPAWLLDGLEQDYVFETSIRGERVFKRNTP
jgi:4-amino-4-deoxy-L-arabinose transferase-like glycosyltransferase